MAMLDEFGVQRFERAVNLLWSNRKVVKELPATGATADAIETILGRDHSTPAGVWAITNNIQNPKSWRTKAIFRSRMREALFAFANFKKTPPWHRKNND